MPRSPHHAPTPAFKFFLPLAFLFCALGPAAVAQQEGASSAAASRRFQDAERLLTAAVAQTYGRYPNLEDEDITRTLLIAQKYQEALRKHNQRDPKADLGLQR